MNENPEPKYRTQQVKVLKINKEKTVQSMQKNGWELTDESDGRLQTTLTFRKPAPVINKKIVIPVAVGAVVLLAGLGVVGLLDQDSSTTASPSASSTTSGAVETTAEEPETPAASAETWLPSNSPSQSPLQSPSYSPTPDVSTATIEAMPLTVESSPELAQLLTTQGDNIDYYSNFAETYKGQTIEFDGSVQNVANSGSYTTRYDILVVYGDYNPDYYTGPTFKFKNVSGFDLGIPADDPLDSLSTGQNIHIKAVVKNFDPDTAVMLLDPVQTTSR